jgi:hypothetical protein
MTDPPRITDDGERISLGLEPQCALGRSNVPQVRRAALFFQFAHGLLLEDRELGLTREKALRSHDWDALQSEAEAMDV